MMAEILDALAKLVRLAARQAVTHPAIVKPLDMPGLAMQAVTFAVGDPAALVRALDTLLHPVESPVDILAAAVAVAVDVAVAVAWQLGRGRRRNGHRRRRHEGTGNQKLKHDTTPKTHHPTMEHKRNESGRG